MSYWDLLTEDLQALIIAKKDEINYKQDIFLKFVKIVHKKKMESSLYYFKHLGYHKYYNPPLHMWWYKNRYDYFEYIGDEKYSDRFLYENDRINEIKNKYCNTVINDLFNPDILTFDREESHSIEKIRRFLFLIS